MQKPQPPLSYFIFVLVMVYSVISTYASNTLDNEPSIIIQDTLIAPGELMLRVDAINFVEDNGEVSAITLRIEVDTFLVQFVGIQNMTLDGSWLANYNIIQDEITIIYNAPFGEGYDVDGKLLDIHVLYSGGYSADLNFKVGCEVTNANLQTITGIVYEDGTITQIPPVGMVMQDTVIGFYNQSTILPVMAQGNGYDNINQIALRMSYDTNQLEYEGFVESALLDVYVADSNSVLIIEWEDNESPVDFTALDTLLFLQFKFIGDTNSIVSFLPGSKVTNNSVLVASEFIDGLVRSSWLIELGSSPVNAGETIGAGYYFQGDEAIVTAIPDEGFRFVVWTEDGQVVSVDSAYLFIVHSSRSLIANFQYDSECSAPVGLYVDELSEINAMLHWISSGGENEWSLLWGEMGFDTITGGILVEGLNETLYFLDNLESGTSYDFYVRAMCTNDIHSRWAGPNSFHTWFVGNGVELFGKHMVVFPNPTNSKLNIKFNENIPSGSKYQIVNSIGFLRMAGAIYESDSFSIDVRGLSPGVYLLRLYLGNNMVTNMFVVE